MGLRGHHHARSYYFGEIAACGYVVVLNVIFSAREPLWAVQGVDERESNMCTSVCKQTWDIPQFYTGITFIILIQILLHTYVLHLFI